MVERLLKLIYKDRNFYKIVAAMMVPVALQNMITIGVNITDTMMLGALGETQLSASSLAGQYINIFQIFLYGNLYGCICAGTSLLNSGDFGTGLDYADVYRR